MFSNQPAIEGPHLLNTPDQGNQQQIRQDAGPWDLEFDAPALDVTNALAITDVMVRYRPSAVKEWENL